MQRLLDIMATLRDPQTGCPWDVAQDFATIAPYTIEEAYEVADAIEHGDPAELKDELGDLLLATAGLARAAGVDPEHALRDANARFEARLRHVESGLRDEGREMSDAPLDELLARWSAAKGATD